MTEPPTFLRRPRLDSVETGVRDILSKLKASADHETCEVLAGATNVYTSAIIRFRGNSAFGAKDIEQMLTVWQILLDVKQPVEQDYRPRAHGEAAMAEDADE